MRQVLSRQDSAQLDKLLAEVESRTGTQIVLAVIQRSDSYPELPWKAFAFGASIAGSVVLALPALHSEMLVATVSILAAGGVCALLTVFLPIFARFFLAPHRAEAEVLQYAQSLFLEKELFATSKRQGLLVLISMFEHQVVLLPDRGLREKLPEATLHGIIDRMLPALQRDQLFQALETGLEQVVQVLGTSSADAVTADELPNEMIVEQGV